MADRGKVKFGISNVHVSKITIGENGEHIYGEQKAVPGAVTLGLEPQGDESKFYADNIPYFSDFNNAGYEASLTIADIPEFVETELLGSVVDDEGAIIESSDDKASEFALTFQVEGDKLNRRVVLYNCKLSRPNREYNTIEEGKEPTTDELTMSVSPRHDNKLKAMVFADNSKYNDMLTTVYEPVITATP